MQTAILEEQMVQKNCVYFSLLSIRYLSKSFMKILVTRQFEGIGQ